MSTHPQIIKHKVGLLHLAEELGNVSQACKVMGYSRDTFYRYRQTVDEDAYAKLLGGLEGDDVFKTRCAPGFTL